MPRSLETVGCTGHLALQPLLSAVERGAVVRPVPVRHEDVAVRDVKPELRDSLAALDIEDNGRIDGTRRVGSDSIGDRRRALTKRIRDLAVTSSDGGIHRRLPLSGRLSRS